MKIAALVLAVLFGYAGVMQYNDPDPLRWVVLYGAAVLITLWLVVRPPPRILPLLLGAVAAVWAVTLVPGVLREAAYSWNEEERELGGLVITAIWMLFIGLRGIRGRADAGATTS